MDIFNLRQPEQSAKNFLQQLRTSLQNTDSIDLKNFSGIHRNRAENLAIKSEQVQYSLLLWLVKIIQGVGALFYEKGHGETAKLLDQPAFSEGGILTTAVDQDFTVEADAKRLAEAVINSRISDFKDIMQGKLRLVVSSLPLIIDSSLANLIDKKRNANSFFNSLTTAIKAECAEPKRFAHIRDEFAEKFSSCLEAFMLEKFSALIKAKGLGKTLDIFGKLLSICPSKEFFAENISPRTRLIDHLASNLSRGKWDSKNFRSFLDKLLEAGHELVNRDDLKDLAHLSKQGLVGDDWLQELANLFPRVYDRQVQLDSNINFTAILKA